MIEGCQSPSLPPQARQPFWVVRELAGQGFNRDIPAELAVMCAIHFAHATGAKRMQDLIGAKLLAYLLSTRQGARHPQGGCFQEASGLLVCRE